jgi:DNA-directed RNA polymerase subunit omega
VIANKQILQQAVEITGQPEILVNAVSKRVRQLGQGFRPMIEVHPRWSFMEIALREIAENKIIVEPIDPDISDEEDVKHKKTKKQAA